MKKLLFLLLALTPFAAQSQLVSQSNNGVRSITCGTGLAGGTIVSVGTCSINFGSTSGTAAQGNDTRFPASVTGIRLGAGVGSADTAAVAGNFPTLNQNTTGNAATATALQTARAINGVNFDGTAAITVPAAAGTLTGATLAAGVTASSLTSVGTLTGGSTGAGFTVALGTSTITGTLGVTNGGSGLNTATLGDFRYGSGTNTIAALAGNTTTTKQFITQTGNGTVSAAPAWATIASADLTAALTTPPPIGGTTPNVATFADAGGGNSGFILRSLVGAPTTVGAIYSTAVTPSGNNQTLSYSASQAILNHTSAVALRISNTTIFNVTSAGVSNSGTLSSTGGAISLNASSNFTTSINTGTNTQNATIGGASNTTVIASHLASTGSAPVIAGTGCVAGTAPAVTDSKGSITVTAATSCTVTFNTTYATAPACVVSSSSTTVAAAISSISTTVLTIGSAALTGTLYYICEQ